jgi:hypothetical protein
MLTIAYYDTNNKFQAIAGRNFLGLPWRTKEWERPVLFSCEADAKQWEIAHHHLTGEGRFVIIEEERARHLLKFGC